MNEKTPGQIAYEAWAAWYGYNVSVYNWAQAITEIVGDAVNADTPWGWEEVPE